MPDTPRWLPAYEMAKDRHPDALLFYRLGDFYELLFADAVAGAKALGITLTRRGEIPMCGIPVHSHERYLAVLDEAGIPYAIHGAPDA